MVSLAGHLQSIESEKQKLRSQVRRLCQENAWLRDELADTQQRLQQSEQRCVTLDEERTHLQFMNDMRKYDSESSHQVAHFSSSSSLSSSSFLDLFIGTTVCGGRRLIVITADFPASIKTRLFQLSYPHL